MITSMIVALGLFVVIQKISAVPVDGSTINEMNIISSMIDDPHMKETEVYNIHDVTTDPTEVMQNYPWDTKDQQYYQKREAFWEDDYNRPRRNCRRHGCGYGRRCINCWGTWTCMREGIVC